MAPLMELDYSQLSMCFTCPMKWWLTYEQKLRKKSIDERDIDKLFGKRVHKCLECYYKMGDKDMTALWDDFVDLPPEASEFHKTKANGIKLCQEYLNHYSKLDNDMEILDVELVERTPISDSLTWITKLDTVVKKNDNIYSLEHKTTKSIQPTYFNQFSPNMQVSGQTYAVQKKYGQCSGVLVNVLMSGYRQRSYKGEPAGFHCKFQREIINRDARQITDFKANVSIGAEKLLEFQQNPDIIFKNESACHQYRGCQFKEICLTSFGIQLDEEIIDVLYDKVENPLAYLEEKEESNGTEDQVVSA